MIQKSIINAKSTHIPHIGPGFAFSFLVSVPIPWAAYLTGSEYDPVVVLRSIFFDFLRLLSSYTHSYWTQVLICPKIVPVFLYIREKKNRSLSYFLHFNCISMLDCYTGNKLPAPWSQ